MKMLIAMLGVAFAALGAWPAPGAFPIPAPQGETTAPPLKMLRAIPIPGLKDGDFDHFAVDLAGDRLFLTAEKNSAVEVFDLNTNDLIHTITGWDEPHSMLYRADLKKLFVVDGGAAEVRMYDSTSYKYLGGIKLKDDCDSMAYDPATKYLYVVNGGRGAHEAYSLISIIDTTTAKKLADIRIETDSVEALALEKSGPRLFVNMTGLNSVGVFDREKHTCLPPGQSPRRPSTTYRSYLMKRIIACSSLLPANRRSSLFWIRTPAKLWPRCHAPVWLMTWLSILRASASTLQEPILSMFFNKRMPIITSRSDTFRAVFAPKPQS